MSSRSPFEWYEPALRLFDDPPWPEGPPRVLALRQLLGSRPEKYAREDFHGQVVRQPLGTCCWEGRIRVFNLLNWSMASRSQVDHGTFRIVSRPATQATPACRPGPPTIPSDAQSFSWATSASSSKMRTGPSVRSGTPSRMFASSQKTARRIPCGRRKCLTVRTCHR